MMAGKKQTSETQNTTCEMTQNGVSLFKYAESAVLLFRSFSQTLCGVSFLGELERAIRAQHLFPPGKTCR